MLVSQWSATRSRCARICSPTPSTPSSLPPAACYHPRVMTATRLLNRDFLLLWQGKLVSMTGDFIYELALGFWVLQTTGSTALMGGLMAATLLPRVLVSPFAGVLVDRLDRKWLIVGTDLVRGVVVGLVALAAFAGVLQIWMVFGCGVILGIAAAFFLPAADSVVPDIVPPSSIVQANSLMQIIMAVTGVLGNATGGILYGFLGAPVMFLINAASYLVSSGTELFIRVPRVEHARPEFDFMRELREGLQLVIRMRGIRAALLIFAAINFFAGMLLMLLLPLFESTPWLGPQRYGIFMATLTGGMAAGLAMLSVANISPRRRFALFFPAGLVFAGSVVVIATLGRFWMLLPLAVVIGMSNALLNTFVSAVTQAAIPPDRRGKVLALQSMAVNVMMPLAFAFAGVIAEFVELRLLVGLCGGAIFLVFLPVGFMAPVRRFINFDPASQTIEDLL